jgi:hypothetical protein
LDCAKCIVTAAAADHYGPLVSTGGLIQANVAGCIEALDPHALSCAKAEQAKTDCELAACAANCPVSGSASLNAAATELDLYLQCAILADSYGCQAYVSAAACVGGELEAGASVCLFSDFMSFYFAVVPIFCGPTAEPLTDAGAPDRAANDAGPTDAASTVEDGSARDADAGATSRDSSSLDGGTGGAPLDATSDGAYSDGSRTPSGPSDAADAMSHDAADGGR